MESCFLRQRSNIKLVRPALLRQTLSAKFLFLSLSLSCVLTFLSNLDYFPTLHQLPGVISWSF